MLKFTNLNRTAAAFNGASFSLSAPEDWDSIGDGPAREAVKAWLAAGNTPLPADVPSFNDQRDAYLAEVRETRERILNRLAGIGAAAIVSGDTDMQMAFATARQQLLDITADPAVVAATSLDDLKAAVLAAYRGIVASAPESIVNAFNTVDE